MRFTLALVAVALVVAGCGGVDELVVPVALHEGDPGSGGASVATGAGAGEVGGSADASSGTGGREVGYPAPHPGMPEIPDHGGSKLHDPVIATVTFPGETLKSFFETFDDTIGATEWWKTVHSSYGVGPATAGAHVAITEAPPASLTDGEIQAWLIARVADGTLLPATDQTIYVLYYPATTSIDLQGEKSCDSFGGYHSSTSVTVDGKKLPIAYAVIPRCGGKDSLTTTVSHELTEASSDPHPPSGYYLTTKSAWALAGGENADMCSFVQGVTEGDYEVTRVWSNENAKLGDNPCVPVPPDPSGFPYYNAAIVNEIAKASPGETITTEVDCYSFGPLPNEMTLEGKAFSADVLTFELDKPTCKNGDKVTLTIHVDASAKKATDYHYSLRATVNEESTHSWRGLVTVK